MSTLLKIQYPAPISPLHKPTRSPSPVWRSVSARLLWTDALYDPIAKPNRELSIPPYSRFERTLFYTPPWLSQNTAEIHPPSPLILSRFPPPFYRTTPSSAPMRLKSLLLLPPYPANFPPYQTTPDWPLYKQTSTYRLHTPQSPAQLLPLLSPILQIFYSVLAGDGGVSSLYVLVCLKKGQSG